MFLKDRRRAERRWRSRCKFIRRLKTDWWDHGLGWSPRQYPVPLLGSSAFSPWSWTTLCPCFYDPKAQARFKDTPSLGHRQRACNGKDGDRMNELKAERQLEVSRAAYGTTERRAKRARQKPRKVKVTCLCGYLLGFVFLRPFDRKSEAVSKKFGKNYPKCPNCEEKTRRPV